MKEKSINIVIVMILFVAYVLFMYGIWAFVNATPNYLEWSFPTRLFYALFGPILGLVYCLMRFEILEP